MASIVGPDAPNPNDYDPISTLDKQYSSPPLGRRLTLLISLSPSTVHIPGGIETVLKSTSSSTGGGSRRGATPQRGTISGDYEFGEGGGMEPPAVEAVVDMGDIRLKEINVSGGEDDSIDSRRSAADGGERGRKRSDSVGSQGRSSSPFQFLYGDFAEKEERLRGGEEGGSERIDRRSSGGTGKKQFGGFSNFKNNLKKGWDRSVTNMVLQAQKVAPGAGGTGTRDLLTVGAYVRNGRTGMYDTCIGMTERAEVPAPKGLAAVARGRGKEGGTRGGLTFRIPILLDPVFVEAAMEEAKARVESGTEGGDGGEGLIQFQVWIRSGAAIFTKSRGLRSYYPVGYAGLPADSILGRAPDHQPSVVQLPIRSDVVTGGWLSLTVLGDMKFPGLRGHGWSLTDPAVDEAYNDYIGKKMFFNAPLDQSFVFPITPHTPNPPTPPTETSHTLPTPPPPPSPSPSTAPTPSTDYLIATERSTESTVILPLSLAVSRLLSTASQESLQHALALSTQLQYLHDAVSVSAADSGGGGPGGAAPPGPEHHYAHCQISLLYLLRSTPEVTAPGMGGGGRISVGINLQRPDCIFENCLLSDGQIPTYHAAAGARAGDVLPTFPSVSVPFYPRIVRRGDGRMLPGLERGNRSNYLLGRLRLELYEEGITGAGADVFSPIGPTSAVGISPSSYDILLDIEPYLKVVGEDEGPGGDGGDIGKLESAPVVDSATGQNVGTLVFQMKAVISAEVGRPFAEEAPLINLSPTPPKLSLSSPPSDEYGGASFLSGGLISLVGLDTLMLDDKACYPYSDIQPDSFSPPSTPSNAKPPPNATPEAIASHRRRRQVATMGEFLTFDYMDRHAGCARATNAKIFLQRADEYERSLHSQGGDQPASVTPDERRDPRPFRPSSSRMDPLLTGIGFNVHVHNLSLQSVTGSTGLATLDDTGEISTSTARIAPHTLFQNVTCGAPSDHFAGFDGHPNDKRRHTGGLRRLEAERLDLARQVRESQDELISAVASYYNDLALGANGGSQKSPGAAVSASSMRHVPYHNARIMRRRKACIEATEMLHELTWNIAVRRGNVFSQALGIALTSYLSHVSDFRKLAEGVWADVWKHHGFLVTFEGLLSAAGKELGMIEDASVAIAMLRMVDVVLRPEYHAVDTGGRVPVPESPHIVWLNVVPSGSGTSSRFRVEVGIDSGFYNERIPIPLRDGTSVRFYPILYQMGVDIRQWGVNAGANMSRRRGGAHPSEQSEDELDDNDDKQGSHDVLKELNYEAFRKMNAYAHSVNPCDTSPKAEESPPSWESAHNSQQQVLLAIHPSLSSLYEYIRTSAGKMEHGILDEAATAAARLGGGSAIFCKSGKDRTAMQVTFKQAQFVSRVFKNKGNGFGTHMDREQIMKDAATMRVYGTRLPICEKNVGQALFAFNSLQARFMPDMLKPPPRTLAGFLKGGRVFSKGGIES